MSTGLIALLDDVVGLAKVAAASLDDVGAQAAKAGAKAAGVVIDDAAVTPRYVVGFASARELPIVGRIAWGSLRNKLLFLLPASLALSLLAPWAITPILMLGGAYLCYEGAEKVLEAIRPHAAHAHEAAIGVADPVAAEDARVRSAIQTDFILSAEVMAITLGTMPEASFWSQATVLAAVGIGVTVAVYGAVALIVKADDAGLAMAQVGLPAAGPVSGRAVSEAGPATPPSGGAFATLVRGLGHGIVLGMPVFLKLLAIVGTAAMVWVGGGIIVHGLEEYGLPGIAHALHAASDAAAGALPAIGAAAAWLVTAAGSGVVGLLVGALVIPLVQHVGAPILRMVRGGAGQRAAS